MKQPNYQKPVIVKYGVESFPFYIAEGFCVVDLVFNEKAIAILGYSPFNVRVLRNGVTLNYLDLLVPGESITIEMAVNTKEALPGPKSHKCERYRRKRGWDLEPSKGDHSKWIIDGHAVSVNYCNGELDINSLKAIAHQRNIKPRDLILDILKS